MGTVMIGFIAFKQNGRANEINNRLLELQEINTIPHTHIDVNSSGINFFDFLDIDLLIGFRNETNSVINIIETKFRIDGFYQLICEARDRKLTL